MFRFKPIFLVCAMALLNGCTANPATGQQQFTALMSPGQEQSLGAQEHGKVVAEFGVVPSGSALDNYVQGIGRKITAGTERRDVTYKFFVLDTPMMNAFALPGGYIYVTRGILAQAGNEAELAAVLAHEVGHITARHAAERYSQGVLASLGVAVIAAAADSAQLGQAADIGTDLYMKSYSRGQESQADELGIRYLSRAGYDPGAMAGFLESLGAHDDLEKRMQGQGDAEDFSYFSTHPRTQDRMTQAAALAAPLKQANAVTGRNGYLDAIDGLVWGDSARQGFVRGQSFYHTEMGFGFSVPDGFTIDNQPSQVVALSRGTGAAIIFDSDANPRRLDAATYLTQTWMKGQAAGATETLSINGKNAATMSFPGRVNGRAATIRIIAVEWAPDLIFRFQIALPQGASPNLVDEVKRSTYSLHALSAAEKADLKPWRLRVVVASPGDTAASIAAGMPFDSYRTERFLVLNGMNPGQAVTAGQRYKIVSAAGR